MAVDTPEQASSLIKRWLVDRGYFVEEEKREEAHFQYAARSGIGMNFVVVQPKALRRSVIVAARLTLHPDHLKALHAMNPSERHELLMDIRYGLLFSPTAFRTEPPEDDLVRSFVFEVEITYDELTEGSLLRAMNDVQRGLLYVVWKLTDAFGKAQSGEDYDMMVQ
ncbi:DUF2299 family protein [Methermicoccus shengliensis]|uniref:DUF2299 family protein n=1 Tax=Methermicoccus shengliensis TaxID=660064 RepID=A0A832VNE1_9EURY|nr:DUF2299 family protein [Methermicoccus shengliensis]KUK04300.1 MAG: Uncharacterized protein XD46_0955 [Euryarchaeota archaeon 55_53]KUK30643.1 MAG: Uncharacterized protein XD62_0345 [Methanosarcinales archeaon 56_1174]MDI3488192.1 hypothetical protein [Methanosarcinales archaeon]MDN5295467.1 hypothetical protein [Methanosarcinales archaeon]HIH70231.1 DUF2299 family protein [Methermicoccus shengliensis]